MKSNGRVIVFFPGMINYFTNHSDTVEICRYSDHISDDKGNRNPNSIRDFLTSLNIAKTQFDYVLTELVSTDLLCALDSNEYPYVLVYPTVDVKDLYIKNFMSGLEDSDDGDVQELIERTNNALSLMYTFVEMGNPKGLSITISETNITSEHIIFALERHSKYLPVSGKLNFITSVDGGRLLYDMSARPDTASNEFTPRVVIGYTLADINNWNADDMEPFGIFAPMYPFDSSTSADELKYVYDRFKVMKRHMIIVTNTLSDVVTVADILNKGGYIYQNDLSGIKESNKFVTVKKEDTRMAKIISGFPGVGKSFAATYHNVSDGSRCKYLDLDSSTYSWTVPGVRNPNFVEDYLKAIMDNMHKADYIFISSHKEVRDKLQEANVPYTLVCPRQDLKSEYLDRYRRRGSSKEFIAFMDTNWDKFISDISNGDNRNQTVVYFTDPEMTLERYITKMKYKNSWY